MKVISLSSLSFFILVTKGLSYYIHDISKNRPYPTCSSEGRLIFLARHRRLTKYMMPPVAAIARVVVATTTPAARDRSSPVTTSAASKSSFIFIPNHRESWNHNPLLYSDPPFFVFLFFERPTKDC